MIDPTSGSIGRPGNNWNVSPRPGGQVSGAAEAGPIFPRSGWSDASSLSARAQDALNRLNNDYSGVSNWRWGSGGDWGNRPSLPDMAAMYGMAYPPKNDTPSPGGPARPPDMAAMYGMAYPPKTDTPSSDGPARPPDMAAMYGMAYPPKTDFPSPGGPARPPDMAAMYGMAYPPKTDFPSPGGPTRPPDMAAMYGMAYPNS